MNLESYDEKLEIAKSQLRNLGLKLTRTRLAVLRCFLSSKTPLTPKMIITKISEDSQNHKEIDHTSVYRILDNFHKYELIHEVHPGKGFVFCSHQTCNHPMHIMTLCTRCELFEEIPVPTELLSPTLWYLEEKRNFKPQEHFLQINGLCTKCQS